MYFQILSRSLWGALLFIVLFSGCKKDTVFSTSAETPYWSVTQEQYQQSISSLKSDEDKHFFDFTYASLQNNAVIKTASSRVDSQEILRALAVKLIQLNKQQPFITGVVQRVGYPMWDKAAHLNAPSTQNPGVFLPFASLDADSTQGFLVAIPDEHQNWILKLIDRKNVENNIHQPDSMPNFYFNVAMFFNFDSLIFGKTNKRYGTILANSEGGIIGSTDRGCVTYSTLSCYTMAITGGVSERDCHTYWTVYCYGEPFSGSNPLSTGGGYPNTSGGGGGGSTPSPFTASDAAFAAFWGKCQAGKIGEDVVGGLVGDDIALCEAMEHMNSLGLFDDDQLALLYKDPLLRSEIQAYLEAHPNDPNAMQIVSVILAKVRQQKITTSQVTQMISAVNTLSLTPQEVEWLSDNSVHLSSIHSFGNQYGTEVDAKQYVKNHLAEMRADPTYENAIEDTYLWPPILWTIGKELFTEKAVDIIFNLVPGFNKKDEVKDAIKAAASGDWLAFTWEVGKIVAGQVPVLKALNAAIELGKLGYIADKIYILYSTIGANRLERAWNILKTSSTKFSANALRYVDDLATPKLGGYFASLGTYNPNFKNRFSEVAADIGEIHHAVPQWVTTRYQHLGITQDMMHSLENLRGIPKNGSLDHTTITNYWEAFYNTNPNATLNEVLGYAKWVDNEFGHLFIPPVR